MTYNPNIPIGENSPASQIPQVQQNFASLASVFANNHTPFNNFNQGDHEAIIFQNQTLDPDVTQNLDVIYAKNATQASGTQPQLFLRIPSFLPLPIQNLPMQLTYNSVNTTGPQYQSFLPGGYVVYFGTITNVAVPIVLSPTPSEIVCAIANPNNLTSVGTPVPFDVSVQITQPATVKVNSALATGSYTFTYIVIAKV